MIENAKKGQFKPPGGRPRTIGEVRDAAPRAHRRVDRLLDALDAVRRRQGVVRPPRRDRPVAFTMPEIESVADLTKASAALLQAVASGELTPAEAAELGKLVEAHVRAIEATEFQRRLEYLEAANQERRRP